jgi:hypothetical protein
MLWVPVFCTVQPLRPWDPDWIGTAAQMDWNVSVTVTVELELVLVTWRGYVLTALWA